MAEESQALVRFSEGWRQQGVSADGLPYFVETIRITKSIPPYTEIESEATEQDFLDYPLPYEHFMKAQRARRLEPSEGGFPLALWPVASRAHVEMLAARNITTIEQLAKLARRADDGMPGEFRELAQRAEQMLALSQEVGKYEAMIRDRDGRIEALTEQVAELRNTIKQQDGMLNTLRARVA